MRRSSDVQRSRRSRVSEDGISDTLSGTSRPVSRTSDVFLDAQVPSEAEYSRSGSRLSRRHSGRESSLIRAHSSKRNSAMSLNSEDTRPRSRLTDYASAAEDSRPASRIGTLSVSQQRELADDMVGITPEPKPRSRRKKERNEFVDAEERPRRHRRRPREGEQTPRHARATPEARMARRARRSVEGRRHRRHRTADDASVRASERSAALPVHRVRRPRAARSLDASATAAHPDVPPALRRAHRVLPESRAVQERRAPSASGALGALGPPAREPRGPPPSSRNRLSGVRSPPSTVSGGSTHRLFGILPRFGRSTPTDTLSVMDDSRDTKKRAIAEAKERQARDRADAQVRAIQEKNEAKQRAAEAKLAEQNRAAQSKAEAKERVAQAKLEAKEQAARRKAEAKEQAALQQQQKREAAELARQRKADEKERRAFEKSDAKAALQRQREMEKTEAIAAAREKERMRELAEMDRKQKRLLALTPFQRRERGAEVQLTPVQRHGLLKSLVMMQMLQEFLDFGRPGILTQYGYPFASETSQLQHRRRVELAFFNRRKTDVARLPKGAVDALHEPLILRHMFHVHLRHFPGLDKAPASFYRKRIQRLNDLFSACAMSTSHERGELVLSHMLSLVGAQYLGLYFARGFGVRGEGEERGPGIGDPGTEEWGVGKHWGAGTVKRGLDCPYELTEHDYELIDGLFYGADLDSWLEAGHQSRRVQGDFSALKEMIIEQETGMEEIVSYLSVSNVNNLPPHLQNCEEWVRIHIALIFRWLFVESPSADDLFNFVRVVHMLFPYWPARQILKIANAQVMIQMMLSLLLAQPAGTKSLFQRIVGFVVSRGISQIQRDYIDPIRREISEPALVQKVEAYVRHRTTHDAERVEVETRESGNDILTTILLSNSEPRLDAHMCDKVLDLQRAFAASPYRGDPGLAYPSTTPRGKDQPPIPGWGVSVGDASKARLFALLKLLLRESLNKRDREQFSSLLSKSIVPDIIREGAQIIFYDWIRDVASVADLSGRLGDLQKLIEDMITVRKTTDNSPERWVDLANRHHEFIYFFVHECAPVLQPLWEWCQKGCDFMSLSTTDPLHPADRSAEDIEVNLDEMLQDARLSESDVDSILCEMDALTQFSRWQKIRRELEFRKLFLLSLTPGPSGLWRDSLPSTSMREAVADVDGLMADLLEAEGIQNDDGLCDAVRGTERADVPWAYFDVPDPLGQGILAEPESDEHRVRKPRVGIKPPSLDATRKLLPMFRELLVAKLPDWLDTEVNGEPIPQPNTLLQSSNKLLKRRGLLRRG